MAQPPEKRLKALYARHKKGPIALAESCTGGLIAQRITSVAGSSDYFDRCYVVYSNEAKTAMLGVPEELIERCGAVSEEVALALLNGLFERTRATFCASVTGVAGPDGGTPQKPVGTVWIAWGTKDVRRAELLSLSGSRRQIRAASADFVLERLCAMMAGNL